jgi:(p)ppGpp synthase/HD superfamily hydrolase
MTTIGYSDRINHALAFAAKHHDQQVRKGARPPYFTAPANVAVILTRYACDEQTVVAGILQPAVEDYVLDGFSDEAVRLRLADKFGDEVVSLTLTAVRRRVDDDGVELSHEEQKTDLLERLAAADVRARWVAAAHEVHDASSLLTDLRRTFFPDAVWRRFAEGRESKIRWFRQLHDRLSAVGFTGAIMHELGEVADALTTFSEERASA